MKFKLLAVSALSLLTAISLSGCPSDADLASQNISTAADNFQINRRIVFYNVYTNDYVYVIEGLCSKGNDDTQYKMTVTCKVGPNQYKKHYLGLTDGLSYFMEQLDPADVNTYHYKVIFKPSSIVPDVMIK